MSTSTSISRFPDLRVSGLRVSGPPESGPQDRVSDAPAQHPGPVAVGAAVGDADVRGSNLQN